MSPELPAADRARALRFAPRLLAWFETDGRKDLPWQRDPVPYRVWISEVMLQQTQVATVERCYNPFVEGFAAVLALANAAADEVLHIVRRGMG